MAALCCKNQKTLCLSKRTNLHGPSIAQTQGGLGPLLKELGGQGMQNEAKRDLAITRGSIMINHGERRLRTTRKQIYAAILRTLQLYLLPFYQAFCCCHPHPGGEIDTAYK